MKLKTILFFFFVTTYFLVSEAGELRKSTVSRVTTNSLIDCDFNTNYKSMCGWKKSGNQKTKAVSLWKLATRIRNTNLEDISRREGKFIVFRPRHQRTGTSSTLRSKYFRMQKNVQEACLSFYSVVGVVGKVKSSLLSAQSKLEVYVVPKGGKKKHHNLVWTSYQMRPSEGFQLVTIRINRSNLRPINKTKFRVYLQATKGTSSKSYIAVDEIKLRYCGRGFTQENNQVTASPGIISSTTYALPAQRNTNIYTQHKSSQSHQVLNEDRVNLYATRRYKATVAERQPCELLEYTSKLAKCLRSFFVEIASAPTECSSLYDDLEMCVSNVANLCVPPSNILHQTVNNTVIDILRNNLKVKKVYCSEQGAFVYPSFTSNHLPRCDNLYLKEVHNCSLTFKNTFQTHHGLDLCSEYYKANECQRHVTALRCRFELQDMLVFGLQLQYQYSHNPFCQEVPISAWWPSDTETQPLT